MATTEESKPPSLSALARGSNNMITIDVGAEHNKYSVYAELISYYSGYFKGTLNGPWKEAEDRVIELPDIEPRVFDIFIDWLYTQKLPRKARDWIAPPADVESGSAGHVREAEVLMMKSYVFADRFIVPQFRVALYNFYANFCNNGGNPPYYSPIIYAFENLPANCAMLTLLIRTHCAYWNENSDTADNGEMELRSELPHEFLFRTQLEWAKMRDKTKAKEIACCDCQRCMAPIEREGCDTCMPLPEVKEVESQADPPSADGNPQPASVTVAPAHNEEAADQVTGQDNQGNDNAQAAPAGNQVGQADATTNQPDDQQTHNGQDDADTEAVYEIAAVDPLTQEANGNAGVGAVDEAAISANNNEAEEHTEETQASSNGFVSHDNEDSFSAPQLDQELYLHQLEASASTSPPAIETPITAAEPADIQNTSTSAHTQPVAAVA